MNFPTLQGLSIPQGAVTQITDVSGRVLWSAGRTSELEFKSASAFTLGVKFPGSLTTPGWDGTMEYNNGNGWQTWNGSTISSGATKDGQCIYVRGTGNTTLSGYGVIDMNVRSWVLTGSNIECNGNIETLLDYATAKTGAHPTMQSNCYNHLFANCANLIKAPKLPATTLTSRCYYGMFFNCTGLTEAPELPATTLGSNCYQYMFQKCTSLIKAPKLPATTLATECYSGMFLECTNLTTIPALQATKLAMGCYYRMFVDCSKVKLSSTQTDTYTKAYRIPTSGSGKSATQALYAMFANTGGTFTGEPTLNTTYYLDESNTIV